MKKIFSLLLALMLTCSVLAAAGPALQSKAIWEPVEIFAYDSDGKMTALDMEALPAHIKVIYTNEYLDSYHRYVDVILGSSEDIEAYYFKLNTDILRLFIEGTVTLQAKKMTQDGATFYACLASNKDMRIFGKSPDVVNNLKLIAGVPNADKSLEAPVTLLNAKNEAIQIVSDSGDPKLKVDVSVFMQSLQHTNGYTVSLAPGKLYLHSANSIDLNYTTRTPVQLNSTTELHLYERSQLYVEFNGSGATQDSTTFKKVIFHSDFGGAVWNRLTRGGAYDVDMTSVPNMWISSTTGGETTYADYISKIFHYAHGDDHLITAADIRDALNSKVSYQIGQELPAQILGRGFMANLEWRTLFNDTDLTGTAVAGGKTYVAKVDVVPQHYYYYSNLEGSSYNEGTYADVKPDAALKSTAGTTHTDQQYTPILVLYPLIDASLAPYFTLDPADQEWTVTQEGSYPATISFSVKGENDSTATYQWYAKHKSGSVSKLSDGDIFQGVSTNVLLVKDIIEAYDWYSDFYCTLNSPLYPTVKSGIANIKKYFQRDGVVISKLDLPEEGAAPDTSFDVDFNPGWATDCTKTITYTNAATGEAITTFKRGDKVNIKIRLEIKTEDAVLLKDVFRAEWKEGGQVRLADTPDKKTAEFTFRYTVSPKPGEISFVFLTMDRPAVGDYLPTTVDVSAAAEYTVFNVTHTPSSHTRMMAGTQYVYDLTVYANSGHYFAEDAKFRLNGELLTPTFNEARTTAQLKYTLPAETAPIKIVELNAAIPKFGEVFDESKYTVTRMDEDKDHYGFGAGTWEVDVDKDNKVLEGHTRAMRLTLNAKEGYYFTPSTSVIVHYQNEKGKTVNLMLNNDLTANGRSMELLVIFDSYPAVHEHEGAEYYKVNNTQHEFDCIYCREHVLEDHTAGEDWIIDTPATATEDGSKHKECTKCHYVLETEVIPKGSAPDVMLGDVDDDKNITASDARLALRRAVDLETFAPGSREFIACDVDKDGSVTANDARSILRAAVDLEDPKSW